MLVLSHCVFCSKFIKKYKIFIHIQNVSIFKFNPLTRLVTHLTSVMSSARTCLSSVQPWRCYNMHARKEKYVIKDMNVNTISIEFCNKFDICVLSCNSINIETCWRYMNKKQCKHWSFFRFRLTKGSSILMPKANQAIGTEIYL